MKDFHAKTKLPLYIKPFVHLIVTDDIKKAHRVFGVEWTDDCSETGGESHHKWPDLHIFVERECLNERWLDHECFHATIDVCEMLGIDASQNDDAGAYLYEWIRDWVRAKVAKML
jgi:hypothetical protein